MAISFELTAEPRTDLRSAAARRQRRDGRLPGIVYGAGKAPQPVTFDHDQVLVQLQHEAFYSHILTVKLDGNEEKVVLRDLHRHPYKPKLLHIDLQRVSETEKLHVHVPLHFMGEDMAPGVKVGGGIVSHQVIEVEVSCLPKHLPEYIEVDLSQLDVGDSVHLSDLKLPEGVEIVALHRGHDHDMSVATIVIPRAAVEAEAAPAAEAVPVAAEAGKPGEATPPAAGGAAPAKGGGAPGKG
jgi:large subunit ribosomal protein L25